MCDAFSTPPVTREALAAWVHAQLGLRVSTGRASQPDDPGAGTPLDYLCHAFFEGHDRWPALPGALRTGPTDVVVWACRGGGKTLMGALASVLDMVFKPGIEVRILAGSAEQGSRMYAHLRRLFDARTSPRLAELVAGRATDRRLRLANGSGVEVLSASHASVRGTRVHKLRCDEVDLFKPDLWEAAQLVTRSATLGGVRVPGSVECLSTMHLPSGVMHELVEQCALGARRLIRWNVVDVLERCGDDYHCAHAELGPCALWQECKGSAKRTDALDTGGHFAIEDALRMKHRVARSTWEAEMLCKRPQRGDCVLPEFEPHRHVVDRLPTVGEGTLWVAGMDFGFRAPTVIVLGMIDEQGRLCIVDERSASGMVLDAHVRALKAGLGDVGRGEGTKHEAGGVAWPAPAWVGVDPAGNATNDQTGISAVTRLRRAGLAVRSKRVPVAEGLNQLRARLAPADESAPTLLVHQRCKVLIKSLLSYRYDPAHPHSEQPLKGEGHDHAVDALRYLVQNLDPPGARACVRYA